MRYKAHQYQAYATERIVESDKSALFLEMGLGKTVITLTAIDELLYNTYEVEKVLIIAPLRVAEDTWSRESDKWDHLQHLTISKILGTVSQRKKALAAPADIYVVNRENVEWLVGMYGKKWPFDMVVIDELSSFKNSNSNRFRALRRVRGLIKRIVGLTGTPAPNGLMDLWAQMYLIDQGERLGSTLGGFRTRFFDAGATQGRVVLNWRQKKETEAAIYKLIGDIAVSMKAEDWLSLPERINRTIPVRMDAKATEKYKQLEKDLLLPFADGVDVVASSAAVLSNKLLQLANGAVYDEEGGIRHIHDAKLGALEDIIEAANGKPVLIFYSYQHDLARLKAHFPNLRTLGKGSQDIAEWNAGNIELLAVHPASAGHGLNMQDGGNIIVWWGLTWSLELYQQANARLHRQGQKNRVIVHHIVTEGSMDEDVMEAIDRKAAGQDSLMEAVKARIERVNAK